MVRFCSWILIASASLPSRGAWIEIRDKTPPWDDFYVAPLAGSVDRNSTLMPGAVGGWVAPLAGSVDRNDGDSCFRCRCAVAPLAGSVDRNQQL